MRMGDGGGEFFVSLFLLRAVMKSRLIFKTDWGCRGREESNQNSCRNESKDDKDCDHG